MCGRASVRIGKSWRVGCLGVRMCIHTRDRITHIINIIMRSRICCCMSVRRRRIHRLIIISRMTMFMIIRLVLPLLLLDARRILDVTDNACPL